MKKSNNNISDWLEKYGDPEIEKQVEKEIEHINKIKKIMKTIAEQLNVKEFPFTIRDSRGNAIYYENSNGYWYKREYDSKGNRIYFEDSIGFWEKTEYDSKGNQIYVRSSGGFWCKKEYDSKGNEVYYEDSRGAIIDNRNIPEYTMEELVDKIGNFKLKI